MRVLLDKLIDIIMNVDGSVFISRTIDLHVGRDIKLPSDQRIHATLLNDETRNNKVKALQLQEAQGAQGAQEGCDSVPGIAECIEAIRSADTVHEILVFDSNLPQGVSAPRIHLCQSTGKEPVMIVEYKKFEAAKKRSEIATDLARDIMRSKQMGRLSWLSILEIQARLNWDAITGELKGKLDWVPLYRDVIDSQYVETLMKNIFREYGLPDSMEVLTIEGLDKKAVGTPVSDLRPRDIIEGIKRINDSRSVPLSRNSRKVGGLSASSPKVQEVIKPSAPPPRKPSTQGRTTHPQRR